VKENREPTIEDVLQPGKNMLAAGYCMYGSSCTVCLFSQTASVSSLLVILLR